MQRKVRVLIVDDSTVIRRLLSDSLAGDASLEVAGTAANGRIALAKIPQVAPDVVTLDMEMPEMDGLQTLAALRKQYPKLPVIMFSTLTQRGAEATLDALALGATDYVTKPANVGSVTAAIQAVRDELIPKLKACCPWSRPAEPVAPVVRPLNRIPLAVPNNTAPTRIDLVAIGSSTGGPNALSTVLTRLPADLPVPVLIVQHMPPIFTKHLADRLNQQCQIHVSEAADGDVIGPGSAWIAPGGFHITVQRHGTQHRIQTNVEPPENSCRPAVDVMLRSVAQQFGKSVLSVILTGMGQDGARGCSAVRSVGGRVIAQDEATSVVWGMPGAVTNAGLAHHVCPLSRIADQILEELKVGRTTNVGRHVGV